MADAPAYDVAAVRQAVLEQLQAQGTAMTTGALATRLQYPLHAVVAALESAQDAGAVRFVPRLGWYAAAEGGRA